MSSCRVYVGGLPHGVRERDLERFFKGYGRIRDILLKNGYGFVEFEDSKDADDAVYELDGKDLLGRRVVVELAKSTARGGYRDRYDSGRRGRYNDRNPRTSRFGPPQRTEYRLVVENLSSSVSWQDLKDYVRQAGEVTYCDAHKERRNEGVVEFISRSDMRAAIEKLDDTELNGRRIRLVEDRRGRRSGGGGRGRSRTRSDSRKRSRSKSRRSTRSRSKSRSRSKARGRRSKSRSATKSKSRSLTHSPLKKSRRVTKSKSRSRSAKRDSRSRSRSKARRDSRSPSKSRRDSRDRSKSRRSQRGSRSASKARRDSRSRERSKSRHSSKSAHESRRDSRSRDRSYSRSRSASPGKRNDSSKRDESMDD